MNKKTILVSFFAAILIIFGLSSCATNKGIDDDHNSKNSLDWAGVYTGTIPSASGMGINVRLRLNSDQSFTLWYEYVDKPNSQYNWTGSFKWDKKGNTITLNPNDKELPPYYKVVENALIQLDMKGKQIKGKLADDYVLKKER
jgi:copper homeostasis protein (lipoprotein)